MPSLATDNWQLTTVLEELLADLLERRLRPLPPLLAGEEVMAMLQLAPGPEIGRWLQQVEERRADGLIRTAEEARDWLRSQPQSGVQVFGCSGLQEPTAESSFQPEHLKT